VAMKMSAEVVPMIARRAEIVVKEGILLVFTMELDDGVEFFGELEDVVGLESGRGKSEKEKGWRENKLQTKIHLKSEEERGLAPSPRGKSRL
jgi:hypothetical protein